MAFKMRGFPLHAGTSPEKQKIKGIPTDSDDYKPEKSEWEKRIDALKKEGELKEESIPVDNTRIDKDRVTEEKKKKRSERRLDEYDVLPKKKKRRKKEQKIKDLKIENIKKIDKIDVDTPKDADGTEKTPELKKSTPIDPTPEPETKKKKKLTRKEKKKLKEAEEEGKKQVDEYLEGLNK